MCTDGIRKPEVLGQLLAHTLDPRQQLPALVLVHQRNQAITHFQTDQVDRLHIIPAQLLEFRRRITWGQPHVPRASTERFLLLALRDQHRRPNPVPPASSRKAKFGMPGISPINR